MGTTYALFLDDVRDPPKPNPHGLVWVVARSVEEAKYVIKRSGMPAHISMDHDLGADSDGIAYPTGFDFAKWLVEESLDGRLDLRQCHFDCHSSNPNGVGLLAGYLGVI